MLHGQQLVESFIRSKSHQGNAQARRRWHGKFIGVDRSSDFPINMFTEIEIYLNSTGWASYGWASKKNKIARRLYQRGVTKAEYSHFEGNQSHWEAFYCSRDLDVAAGYRLPGTTLLRIYIKREKISDIWNTNLLPLEKEEAADIMRAAKDRIPQLRFFGITGPQSEVNQAPETALFGSDINSRVICVPVPNSISKVQIAASPQLGRIVEVPIVSIESIDNFFRTRT